MWYRVDKYYISVAYPLSEEERYSVTVYEGYVDPKQYDLHIASGFTDMGILYVDGLIKNILFEGASKLYITTQSNGLICFQNLTPIATKVAMKNEMVSPIEIAHYLRASFEASIDANASIFLLTTITPLPNNLSLSTYSGDLAVGTLAVISDWSEYLMSELENYTLESMIYLEG